MHYEILETDVGQGVGAVAVPVTYGKPVEKTDICQPYSVAEVLQTVFQADFETVLKNYVRTETEQIRAAGVLPGAVRMKVRLWSYLKTLSKLQQPTSRTVVDVILQSKLEGQYRDGETRYEEADFRLRYKDAGRRLYITTQNGTYLHRYIFSNVPVGYEVDHISLDTLDNRKCNLRICTHQQNQCNQPLQVNNTSGVSGVSYYPPRNKYRARIKASQRDIHLGYYLTFEEAVQARNVGMECMFGSYGRYNDVPDAPEWIRKQVTEKCIRFADFAVCGVFCFSGEVADA